MQFSLLVINPGSTSTKFSLFEDAKEIHQFEKKYNRSDLTVFSNIFDQLSLRTEDIEYILSQEGIGLNRIDCFVGRGGVLPPVKGGTYNITADMLSDTAAARFGEHACNLGAHIAYNFAKIHGAHCYVVDPPSTDDVVPIARVTGLPNVKRRFLTHALSQRGIGRIAAEDLGTDYSKTRMLVAHLGGGISVGAHKHGIIADAICAYHGEGSFSPERCGAIPPLSVLDLIEQGFDTNELRKILTTSSGLWAYLKTTDLRLVEKRADHDPECAFLLDAMAYNIAKSISQLAPMLFDEDLSAPIDAVVLTGGMVRCKRLLSSVTNRVSWIAPVLTYPETCEMEALASGALRVLTSAEKPLDYKSPTEA